MIKKHKIFLCLGLLLISVGIQAQNGKSVPAENKIVFSDPMKTIVVKKSNPVFEIILQSNPTTGYSWSLKNYDLNIILPLTHKFYPPKNKKLVGAPGYEKWRFRVKNSGFIVPQITSITLVYHRPWDEQGAQVINFKVVTDDAH